jgi:hypothetical protein
VHAASAFGIPGDRHERPFKVRGQCRPLAREALIWTGKFSVMRIRSVLLKGSLIAPLATRLSNPTHVIRNFPNADGCERRFLPTPVLASIFGAPKFSTFV